MKHDYSRIGCCLLALSFLVPIRPQAVSQTFCTAGHFTEGSKANITCSFTMDINATKRNFNVVRHPIDSTTDSGSGIYVILCNWANVISLECTGKQEYYLHTTEVTNKVTLTTSSVNKEMEGSYFCQEVPGNGQPTKPCSLFVKDRPSTSSPSSIMTTLTAKRTAQVVTTAATSNLQGESSNYNALLGVCILFIIITFCLVAALIYIRCSFRLQPKHNTRASRVGSFLRHIISNDHTQDSGSPELVVSLDQPACRHVTNNKGGSVSNHKKRKRNTEKDTCGEGHQRKEDASREGVDTSKIAEEKVKTEKIPLTAENSDECSKMEENGSYVSDTASDDRTSVDSDTTNSKNRFYYYRD